MTVRTEISIEDMAAFCKRKGFVYSNSEIYNGLTGFFDFGPYGVELKNNIKQQWWKYHVQSREDVVGIDGSIITHPKVWEASGHVGAFQDPLIECSKCGEKYRADQFIEEHAKVSADGMQAQEINEFIAKKKLVCPKCKSSFKEVQAFNMMLATNVGPKIDEESKTYLRPETAQLMFVDFRLVVENARLKLPFGIAQVGKAFRNEISPRNFLFRCREFEAMEIEYFVHPKKYQDCPYIAEVINKEFMVLSASMQEKKEAAKRMTVRESLEKGVIANPWHAYWMAVELKWFEDLGARKEKFRIRQHLSKEKSHYATDTWDIEYEFPFGWKELQGFAGRGDFDLQQHMKHSGKDLSLFDEETKEKVVPHVIAEPALGVERSFLVFLFDAYEDSVERGNIVLHLHPRLAPIKVGVFPLVNKLEDEAKEIFKEIQAEFTAAFDRSGSIGRRYARADELGIPYCVTVDFDTKEKGVTIRDRETTMQIRVPINELKDALRDLLSGNISFGQAGTPSPQE